MSQSAPTLRAEIERILSGNDRNLVLDLEAVSFIDSSGLGVLVSARRQNTGGSVQIVCTRPATLKLLEITGLGEVLGLTDSLEAATSPSDS